MGPAVTERKLFNDSISVIDEAAAGEGNISFALFSRLAPEIRLQIWKFALPSTRLLYIRISQLKNTCAAGHSRRESGTVERDAYTTRNNLGNIISGDAYSLHVPRFDNWPSTLLRHDILNVRVTYRNPQRSLVAFLHDAMACDPVGRGIEHLALGLEFNDVPLLANVKPSDLHPVTEQSMRRFLSTGLRIFYSVVSPGTEARNMLGSFTSTLSAYHLNRSVTVAPQGEQFQVTDYTSLMYDPRPIRETNLSHVLVRTDPRRTTFHWHRILANFGVQETGTPLSPEQTHS
ncbi:Uu.00g074270.m01.CDS01 [Anthostomella pinea]|uniref:Uu.00g074270.m01.CDS01 n=1 Tax=Anthostomella pinea TaxID=933095 RepID=A0AAI8VVE9_9PEZI|nr:Uu.00g074270.m01.CDS01 [Anthostomella pinea]